ncbi:hypothetical protein ALQ97_100955, partial [Pseudomonas savastanoi pv. glycinea]
MAGLPQENQSGNAQAPSIAPDRRQLRHAQTSESEGLARKAQALPYPTSSSWMNMVERFFRDITVYLRDGSFSSIRELESSITTFLALRNAQPTRYVWNAKGEDILNKIQR